MIQYERIQGKGTCRSHNVKGLAIITDEMGEKLDWILSQPLRWRMRQDCRVIRVKVRTLCQGCVQPSLKRHKLPSVNPDLIKPSSFKVEVKKFNLYGTLRKSRTSLYNTLPSVQTIERERELIKFDTVRRSHPHTVKYDEFYNYLASTVKHRPSLPSIQ